MAEGALPVDLILHGGRIITLDRSNPAAEAVAIRDGRFVNVGATRDIIALSDSRTRVIDMGGRSALPGLVYTHTHIVRGGLNFNLELRWDGSPSLADAMRMLRQQVAVTPPPQWVRVVGGFTAHQFAEKRLPTLDELNAAALIMAFAMGLLSGIHRLEPGPGPPFSVMTGNVTALALALAGKVGLARSVDPARGSDPLVTVIIAFVAGALLGAIGDVLVGLLAITLPTLLLAGLLLTGVGQPEAA